MILKNKWIKNTFGFLKKGIKRSSPRGYKISCQKDRVSCHKKWSM
jgi:hypothetical protein